MKNTLNTIGAIAGIIALVGVLLLSFGGQKPTSQPAGAIASNIPAANSTLPTGTILPNPSNFDYLTTNTLAYIGGVLGLGNGTSVPTYQKTVRASLTSGTSTPCQILNPFTATSTVTNFSMNITTATSSAITWAIGTSTTKYATTTTMLTTTVGASAQTTMTWDPGVNNGVLSSGNYIVAGSGAGTAAGTGAFGTGIVLAGTCQATFTTDN